MKTLLLMASANSSAASCSWWALRIASPNCQAVTGNEMHRATSKLKRAIALRGAWLYRSKCKEQRDSWGQLIPKCKLKASVASRRKRIFFAQQSPPSLALKNLLALSNFPIMLSHGHVICGTRVTFFPSDFRFLCFLTSWFLGRVLQLRAQPATPRWLEF